MNPTTQRVLIGCGGGCLIVVLLGVAGCVAFTSWLRAPGELLEPQALLDPAATGYAEGRLELDNPGTQALFETVVELFEAQEAPLDWPAMRALTAWNRSRQIRDMKRMFPARMSWTVYGSAGSAAAAEVGSDDSSFVLSISVQHASHQFLLTDWILGAVLRRVEGVEVLDHGGESIFVFSDQEEDREAETKLEIPEVVEAPLGAEAAPSGQMFTFLSRQGLFLATSEAAARRAIDRLRAGPGSATGGERRSRLERLFSEVPGELQFRAALLDPGRELALLAPPWVEAEAEDENERRRRAEELIAALDSVEALLVGGGFLPDGDVVVSLELRDPSPAPELRGWLEEAFSRIAEEVPLEWSVAVEERGLVVAARIDDLPQLIDERSEEWWRELTLEAVRQSKEEEP